MSQLTKEEQIDLINIHYIDNFIHTIPGFTVERTEPIMDFNLPRGVRDTDGRLLTKAARTLEKWQVATTFIEGYRPKTPSPDPNRPVYILGVEEKTPSISPKSSKDYMFEPHDALGMSDADIHRIAIMSTVLSSIPINMRHDPAYFRLLVKYINYHLTTGRLYNGVVDVDYTRRPGHDAPMFLLQIPATANPKDVYKELMTIYNYDPQFVRVNVQTRAADRDTEPFINKNIYVPRPEAEDVGTLRLEKGIKSKFRSKRIRLEEDE